MCGPAGGRPPAPGASQKTAFPRPPGSGRTRTGAAGSGVWRPPSPKIRGGTARRICGTVQPPVFLMGGAGAKGTVRAKTPLLYGYATAALIRHSCSCPRHRTGGANPVILCLAGGTCSDCVGTGTDDTGTTGTCQKTAVPTVKDVRMPRSGGVAAADDPPDSGNGFDTAWLLAAPAYAVRSYTAVH